MTIYDLLTIRAVESIALIIILLSGSVLLFRSRRNGITKAMATCALAAGFYICNVLFISLIDVAPLPNLRFRLIVTWDIVGAALILALFWLGYKIVKDK